MSRRLRCKTARARHCWRDRSKLRQHREPEVSICGGGILVSAGRRTLALRPPGVWRRRNRTPRGRFRCTLAGYRRRVLDEREAHPRLATRYRHPGRASVVAGARPDGRPTPPPPSRAVACSPSHRAPARSHTARGRLRTSTRLIVIAVVVPAVEGEQRPLRGCDARQLVTRDGKAAGHSARRFGSRHGAAPAAAWVRSALPRGDSGAEQLGLLACRGEPPGSRRSRQTRVRRRLSGMGYT
jgi:hypothetical protein